MSYDFGSTSHEVRDDDDEDECEEVGGGSHLLGFMFGNVDNSGDLDVDYLDEDAKEHLASLADKLGSSLTDIDLAIRTKHTTSDAAEQDYDEKAEDAVDYEDIDEEYEGPEVQTATEEDFLLSKKDFLSREVSVHTVASSAAVFDDENYDDDEDLEKKDEVMEIKTEVSEPIILEDTDNNDVDVLSQEEKVENISLSGDAPEDSVKSEDPAAALSDTPEEEQDARSPRETLLSNNSTPLPVLYVEDDMVVLRFSEIFGIYEPRKKAENRERVYPVPKEMYKSMDFSEIIEEDEEVFLKGSLQDVCGVGRVEVIPEGSSAFLSEDSESRNLEGTGQGVPDNDHRMKDSCRCSVSFNVDVGPLLLEDCSEPFYQNFCPLDQLDWEDRIIWSKSPVLSNIAAKSGEISGDDADTPDNNKAGLQAEPQILMPKSDDDFCDRPILLEPFDIKDWSESIPPEPQRLYHPQLLRIESRLDQNEPHNTDSRNDGILKEMLHSDTIRRFKKLTMQNRAVLEGSWFDNIIWEPQQPVSKPHLILDLEDE